MPAFILLIRRPVRYIIGLAVTIGLIYLLLAMVGLAPRPDTCITEVHRKIVSPFGFEFEVSETDCDTLAKDTSISVYASRAGQTSKTLLFKYGPAGKDPDPQITAIDQSNVKISVARVSDIIFRKENWHGTTIKYDIGIIEYPTSETKR
jgi:hypothetical protein